MSHDAAARIDPITPRSADASANGDNTILAAPTTGRSILYLCLSAAAANTAAVTCIVKLGAAGATLYKVSLSPGQFWVRDLQAGERAIPSGVAALVVNLSGAQTVSVSVEAEDW